MNKNLIYKFGLLSLVIIMTSSACGSLFKKTDNVTVQLSWFPSVEYSGFYAAIENGYYKDEKLNVTLVPGSPEINPLDDVQNGKAQFGISTGDSLILARANQTNFVAVGTIFRNNPLVAMSLSENNIQKPEDMTGKTVGVIAPDLSSTYDVQFLALMREANVDTNTIKFLPINDYEGDNELKAKNMDVMSGMFATNEPVQAAMAGSQLNLIYYKDYGVDVYSNIIFTTEEFEMKNGDLITRMMRATMKGYQFAIENPEKAAEFAVKYDPTLDLAFQKNVMIAQIPFIDTGDAPIGSMDADVWETTQKILLDFNLITAPVDLNSVYTNQFVNP